MIIFSKTLFLSLRKQVNFKAAITEMYLQISWELLADPLRYAEHTLGIALLYQSMF
jgi:hypothetical protein